MIDKTFWDKLIDSTPLALVVLGILTIIVAAAGGLPLGNPPLQISDPIWRASLAALGGILLIVGVIFLIIEYRNGARKLSTDTTQNENFFIKTYPRSQHPSFFEEVEKLVPKASEIVLIATGLNLIWEKRIVDILLERAKTGKANITICMGNPYDPHVLDRLIEEETTGERAPVGRYGIERNVKALLQRLEMEGNPQNFQLCLFEHYPTFATLKFDNQLFVYPYAYQLLGNESPILHLCDDGSEEARFFVSNVKRIIRNATPARDVIYSHTSKKYFSDEWIAAAVYIIPESDEPLYKFGSSVLGFDIWKHLPIDTDDDYHKKIKQYVGDASKFGFHATLADALFFVTEAEINRIKAELRVLSEEFRPFRIKDFKVVDRYENVGDIVILCDEENGVTEALHHELVSRIYPLAVSSNYLLDKTRKKYPEPSRRSNLMTRRYGSPYILKLFNLHFTLFSDPPEDKDDREKLVRNIQSTFNKKVKSKYVEIDEICLLIKRKNDKNWRIAEKFSLSGR